MDLKKLEGVWYESTEEKQGDRVVYRNAQYDFPRTRAPRPALEFGNDGTVNVGSPGPSDARSRAAGKWKVHGKTLTITAPGRHASYEIESLDEDKLILRQKETANGDG